MSVLMEADPKNEEPGGLPWGIRIASTFLDFFAIIMMIPMFFVGMGSVVLLSLATHDPKQAWRALATSWMCLGAFTVLLACVFGAGWLANYMRDNFWTAAGSQWKAGCPRSPLLMIGQPVLLSVTIYSTIAVIAGCVAKFGADKSSYTWLIAWAVTGGGCYYLFDRYCGHGVEDGLK